MKINKYLVGLATAAIALTTNVNAQQSPEQTNMHGATCQPANLGQAINFNVSWSQNGISNPNPLGSGRSFFIICPFTSIDDQTVLTLGADMAVNVVYSDHDGVTEFSCFARRYADGQVIRQVNLTDTQSAGFTGHRSLNILDVTLPSDQAYNGFRDSHVLVCALPPQARVESYTLDFD